MCGQHQHGCSPMALFMPTVPAIKGTKAYMCKLAPPLQMRVSPMSTLMLQEQSWLTNTTPTYSWRPALHLLAWSHSTHWHVHRNRQQWFPAWLSSKLWSTHYLLHLFRNPLMRHLGRDSTYPYHGVAPMHQCTGRMAAQVSEGCIYGTQSPFTLDRCPPPGLTCYSPCTQRRHCLH